MSESMIIGVDHGYAAMKTAHFSFPSGLVAYEHEPYTLKDVLEYGGKFYVVGSGRQALQKNKTQTEDYYLLTLAAIAKELSFRHAEPATEIHLAAGLPLTSFGRVIHIDLAHLEGVSVFLGDLVEHGGEHLAGAAPVGVEVQQDGLIGIQYLVFKVRSSNFQFSHEKGSVLLSLFILCFSACKSPASWFPWGRRHTMYGACRAP